MRLARPRRPLKRTAAKSCTKWVPSLSLSWFGWQLALGCRREVKRDRTARRSQTEGDAAHLAPAMDTRLLAGLVFSTLQGAIIAALLVERRLRRRAEARTRERMET